MSLIHIQNLTKHFKILNRREGLGGAFRDLFSGSYRTVEAVAGISFDIPVEQKARPGLRGTLRIEARPWT